MTQNPERTSSDEQLPGLVSKQDTSRLQRAVLRRFTGALPRIQGARRSLFDAVARLRGQPRIVELFYQVDDPYSHLAVQAVAELQRRYAVQFRFQLVGTAERFFTPEPVLLSAYARRDCELVAPAYGLEFPANAVAPQSASIQLASRVLSRALEREPSEFVRVAHGVGQALWSGDDEQLERLSARSGEASQDAVERTIQRGNALRHRRKHYSGGMFWCGGEWYWGVDRLYHLEQRLIAAGQARADGAAPRFDRPSIDPGTVRNDGSLRLEVFPSLRSPYSAIAFDRTIEMAAAVNVPVTVRPVLPMVMRGVPAPMAKGIYIYLDTFREAARIGAPFGDMYDPIGEPVKRGFALWPHAREQGRGVEYVSAFLRAAFVEGQQMVTESGLRKVVESAGLSWSEAQPFLESEEWRDELEANRTTLYEELGVWGVPSFRLVDDKRGDAVCVWGQDRLWVIASAIRERLAG